ncbi:MAG TPA: hypothetical protein VF857_08525 [Spirochaetota bacterium]
MKKLIILLLVAISIFIPASLSGHRSTLLAQETDTTTDESTTAPDDDSESLDNDDESIDESELENVDPWLLEPSTQPQPDTTKK